MYANNTDMRFHWYQLFSIKVLGTVFILKVVYMCRNSIYIEVSMTFCYVNEWSKEQEYSERDFKNVHCFLEMSCCHNM